MNRDLAALQSAMAELVRTGESQSAAPYVERVRTSAGLRILRECIVEWREMVLRRTCPLTAARLEAAGALRPAVRRLLERRCPPLLQDLALAFLEQASEDGPGPLRDVAEYEIRMIRACNP